VRACPRAPTRGSGGRGRALRARGYGLRG
jgi:hypothetical protein